MKRVVITGLGAITPLANNAPEFWQALVQGRSGAGPITRFDASRIKTRFACEVKNFDPLDHMTRGEAQKNDLFSQFALAAAGEAVRHAQLDTALIDATRAGVIVGVANGGNYVFQQEVVDYFSSEGPARFHPFFVPKMMANMAISAISMKYGLKGISYVTTTACSSSNTAVMDGFNYIRWGQADVMVCGGAEAPVVAFAVGGFNAMRALSTQNEAPQKASRPFDAHRDGFVLGEGAAMLVLESYEHAIKRGAPILAELAGAAMATDCWHISAPHPEGEGAVRAMRLALQDAGLQPADVDYINAHSTSTPVGDMSEIQGLRKLFGDAPAGLKISATKSMTGHLLGAAGAVESVATVYSIINQMVPPTINTTVLDAAIPPGMDIVLGQAQPHAINVALNNSFGFGGHNCILVYKKI